MVSWGAEVRTEPPLVGCFCPTALLHELRGVFGPDLECDGNDLLAGHAESFARGAVEAGLPPDCLPVQSAARVERVCGPRYAFRLRVGPDLFVAGTLDRESIRVVCEREDDFPPPARRRFVAFLRSLRLGGVDVDGASASRRTR